MKACPRCANPRPCGRHPDHVDRRASRSARGYTSAWYKYRETFLSANPFCVIRGERCTVIATRVDHVIPHRGNMVLFWDTTNHQPACEVCHNRKSQAEIIDPGGFN